MFILCRSGARSRPSLFRRPRAHGGTSKGLYQGAVVKPRPGHKLLDWVAAVRELAEAPLVNGRQLMHDSGALGPKALYEKTGPPENHFPAVRAAIDVARETEYDGRENDRERYSRRMIERILTQYGDPGVDFDSDDLEYLLARMNELPVEIADTA